jgi:hypothetical protein
MVSKKSRILILCKTYPSPSSNYAETSCVAGLEESGELIRIYPMPFRLVEDDKQFKKWQWVEARIEKSKKDHRKESHRVYVDTINCDAAPLPTKNNWAERLRILSNLSIHRDFDEVELSRQATGATLALLRPARIIGLDITPVASPDWTKSEKDKLIQLQQQADLFDESDAKKITTLKKLPYDFHYRYSCSVEGKTKEYRHKIVDWEIGALYWNVFREHGAAWERPFREKIEVRLPIADLQFLMGTIHRFPDQWLIVSLIYPPKQQVRASDQGSLFGP